MYELVRRGSRNRWVAVPPTRGGDWNGGHPHGPYVQAGQVAELIKEKLASGTTQTAAAAAAGVSERMIWRLVHGRQVALSFWTADRICCGLLGDPSLLQTLTLCTQYGRPL